MMRFRRSTVFFAALALAAAFAAAPVDDALAKNDKSQGAQAAKGKGKPDHAGKSGKAHKQGKSGKHGKSDRDYGDYRNEDVIDEFRRYSRDRGDRTPDYLRNPSSLPPGIEKNLRRGKPLPPGHAKKVADDDLLRRLPRTYSGSEWYAAGDNLVEYDPVNEAIINVVERALYGGL